MKMVEVNHVTMKFKLASDKIQSLKEYFIAAITKKIKYRELCVFQDLSFDIEKGEVVGIIGRNGAGKSTLLKIISGVLSPTSGTVKCYGNIVPMLELGSGFDIELSGRENIFLNGSILGYSKKFLEEKYQEIVEFSELGDFIEEPIRNYSSGMLMRLAFSIATMVHPEILIVDEILAVGDEAFQRKSKRKMLELMGGGTTVLFVSHSIDQIREMCSKVIWIENGKIEKIGDSKEVCDAYQHFLNPDQNVYTNNTNSLRNTDAYKYMMDVLIIYNEGGLSYYSALARKEQLLVGNICAQELCLLDIKVSLIKQYRAFLFINCDVTNLTDFIEEIKKKNKTYIVECHDKAQIDMWLRRYPETTIITNEEKWMTSYKAQNLYYIPLAITERLQQIAEWVKYDRDILPFKDVSEIDGEQELINYNKAVMEHKKHVEEGVRIGVLLNKNPIKEIKESIEIVVSKSEFNLQWISADDFEDAIRSLSKVDYVFGMTQQSSEQLMNKILCDLTEVPYCGNLEEAGLASDILNNTKDDCVRQNCNNNKQFYTLESGPSFSLFFRKRMHESVVFLFKSLDEWEKYQFVLDKALEYIDKGLDTSILVSSLKCDDLLYKGIEIPVLNRTTKYVLGGFDTVIVADSDEFSFIITYPNVQRRIYFVSKWGPGEYECGDFNRIRMSQSYLPCVPVEFWTDSKEVSQWLKERYGQEVKMLG